MRVRCTAKREDSTGRKWICNWEGDEDELRVVMTYPGRWYDDPEPPEYEAVCPECGSWDYIEDVGEPDERSAENVG